MLVCKVTDHSEIEVIHYSKSNCCKVTIEKKKIQISEDSIERAEYMDGKVVWSPDEAIERAKSCIGEKAYDLFDNNCESFVNWTLTGQNYTYQGRAAKATIAVGLATFLLCVV